MARLFQFSIRSLLVAVTIAALGIAALLSAGVWWEVAIWTLALFAVATAIPLVIYRRDEARAYWIGFLVFGGLFLGVLFCSFQVIYVNNNALSSNESLYWALPTTRISRLIYESVLPESRTAQQIPGPPRSAPGGDPFGDGGMGMSAGPGGPPAGMGMGGGMPGGMGPGRYGPMGPGGYGQMGGGPVMIANPSYIPLSNFVNIFQALWLLLIAAVGGKVCQLICRTRPQEPAS